MRSKVSALAGLPAALFYGVVGGLLLFGAMFWARQHDPFERIWFKVKTERHGMPECIAVLPKTAPKPLPTIIYLHGSGGGPIGNGNEMRQMAEMGLAVVGMDYDQTNITSFEEQFIALVRQVRRQPWVDTKRMAWVGFSLGAQRLLAFGLQHPDLQPELLVRLSGGLIPELESQVQRSRQVPGAKLTSVLEVHSDNDDVFPIAQADLVTRCLQSNGVPVEKRLLSGQGHGIDLNRSLTFRAVGEYCLRRLNGPEALNGYTSILSWQNHAKPLWLFWVPACVLAVGRYMSKLLCSLNRNLRNPQRTLAKSEIGLRWVAGILAMVAIGQTALHLVPPLLSTRPWTLNIARNLLIRSKEQEAFDLLSQNPVWIGKPLSILLTQVELANYNRELINWKLEEQVYQKFVLSPQIDPEFDGKLDWRRELWENFYPRIRRENGPEAAAEIVVRFLRERVTMASGREFSAPISTMWLKQIADERGFNALYVAALRSVGVPSRLDSNGKAEIWSTSSWKVAPRPLIGRL